MFVAATIALPGTASADTITLSGLLSGQFSTATAVGEFNAQTNTFTFTVTNTSAITQPGSTSTITAAGFDLLPLGNASASGLNGFTGSQAPSLSSNFDFSDGALGAVPNFNNAVLDFGFTTGAGGTFALGLVGSGLLPGESASFTISGAAFTGFTEAGILNSLFLRFENVPGTAAAGGFDTASAGASPTPVPEPSTMLLVGLGLIGAAGAARKRAQSRQ